MRITPSTAVRRMDRPFLVTDRITFSSVSSRYMMSNSYDVHIHRDILTNTHARPPSSVAIFLAGLSPENNLQRLM